MALGLCRFTNAVGGTVDWTYPGPAIDMQSPASAGAANGTVYEYYAQSLDMEQWEIGTGAGTLSGGVWTFARTTVLANSNGDTAKISFLNPPQIAVYDLFAAPSAILYVAQTLTSAQQAQARSNIAVAKDDSVAKAWVSFTGSTGAILTSYNVASISRAAAGIYDITFTTPFASAHFACMVTPDSASTVMIAQAQGKTISTVRVATFGQITGGFGLLDPDTCEVICFGR